MLNIVRFAPAVQQLADTGVKLLGLGLTLRQYSTAPSPVLIADSIKGVRSGPGGRSSVSGITATVFGANGFVGSYVVNELAQRGCQVVIPYRTSDEDVMHLKQMGDLGQVVLLDNCTILDEERIKYAVHRSNVVINLVGRRTETMRYTWEDVHAEWPKRLAKICAGFPQIERFIHFSDLGASETHASRRMRSKAAGDKAVREILPNATIFKPGPVIGDEDSFFNTITYLIKVSPFVYNVDGGVAKMQPTYVVDVAEAVVQALKRPDSAGKDYLLGGPEVLTMREIYDIISDVVRKDVDETTDVPKWLLKLLWARKDFGRRLLPPMPALTFFRSADWAEEYGNDKVVPANALNYGDLGLSPRSVTEGLPVEHVRHMRTGGYGHGDLEPVSKKIPEQYKKLYDTLVKGRMMNI